MKQLHGRREEMDLKRRRTENLHTSLLIRKFSSVMPNNLIFTKMAENK
jgi:hypothetical protein